MISAEIILEINNKFRASGLIDESMLIAFPVEYKIKDWEVALSEEEIRAQMLGRNRDTVNMYKTICINISYDTEHEQKVFKNDYCLHVVLRSMLYLYSITKDQLFQRILLQLNPSNSILRFLIAQDCLPETYDVALSEVKDGHRSSHWMWYIFPQSKGLGYSYMSDFYGIKDAKEAKAYINHPVLGKRLIEITQAYLDTGKTASEVFDSDDIKLKSCMHLFASVSANPIFKIVCEYNHWIL
jgi:uncharacterized protein (DUF1810 family)